MDLVRQKKLQFVLFHDSVLFFDFMLFAINFLFWMADLFVFVFVHRSDRSDLKFDRIGSDRIMFDLFSFSRQAESYPVSIQFHSRCCVGSIRIEHVSRQVSVPIGCPDDLPIVGTPPDLGTTAAWIPKGCRLLAYLSFRNFDKRSGSNMLTSLEIPH